MKGTDNNNPEGDRVTPERLEPQSSSEQANIEGDVIIHIPETKGPQVMQGHMPKAAPVSPSEVNGEEYITNYMGQKIPQPWKKELKELYKKNGYDPNNKYDEDLVKRVIGCQKAEQIFKDVKYDYHLLSLLDWIPNDNYHALLMKIGPIKKAVEQELALRKELAKPLSPEQIKAIRIKHETYSIIGNPLNEGELFSGLNKFVRNKDQHPADFHEKLEFMVESIFNNPEYKGSKYLPALNKPENLEVIRRAGGWENLSEGVRNQFEKDSSGWVSDKPRNYVPILKYELSPEVALAKEKEGINVRAQEGSRGADSKAAQVSTPEASGAKPVTIHTSHAEYKPDIRGISSEANPSKSAQSKSGKSGLSWLSEKAKSLSHASKPEGKAGKSTNKSPLLPLDRRPSYSGTNNKGPENKGGVPGRG